MRQLLAGILAVQLVFPAWAAAQEPHGPQVPAPQQPAILTGSLRIIVLEGEGAINSTERGLARAPVIEVRDLDDRPVGAATVVFRLPLSGPGGFFPDQKLSKTVLTNIQGQAIADGLAPNKVTGRFKIHVTATADSRMGETDIIQTNSANQYSMAPEPVHRKTGWWKWAIIGGAGAGLAIGIILATRGGNSSNTTVTITPGPVTIGGR